MEVEVDMERLLWRLQVRGTRATTSLLRAVGLRDRLLKRREDGRRAKRAAFEARGDDSLSRPALHDLDAKLDRIIDRDDGFFVEAGANDGFTQSNTYWLERFRGWRGVLVEPMPELASEARLSRPNATVVQCVLKARDDPRPALKMQFGDLMSMVDEAKEPSWPRQGTVLGWRDSRELEVQARTLSAVLDEVAAPEVDLLSLDVEGFERQALQGLDLGRHAPRYVLVEIHQKDLNQPAIDEVLADRFAEHGWLSPVDLLYVRRDLLAGA
ncbi:MAG: FkbM family methyltransferase [Solirubrobacteraceae bacterium]